LSAVFGGRAFEIGSSMERMSTFFEMVDSEAPELSGPFRLLLKEFNARIVGNMLARQTDRAVLQSMQGTMKKFLGLDADVVAAFRTNVLVRRSVNSGRPFVIEARGDIDVDQFNHLAHYLLRQDLQALRDIRTDIMRILAGEKPIFGLEGVETVAAPDDEELIIDFVAEEPPPAPPAPPQTPRATRPQPPTPPDPRRAAFAAELARVRSSSGRRAVNQYVEVKFGGHWHIGSLVDISEEAASVAGIRADADWHAEGALRIVTMDPHADASNRSAYVPVRLASYDPSAGSIRVEFDDPAQGGILAEYLRARAAR
jgi:hypothetical protein